MKTKNQTGQMPLELALITAANEDGFNPALSRDAAVSAHQQAWSPYEVWRTRVKTAHNHRPVEAAQI